MEKKNINYGIKGQLPLRGFKSPDYLDSFPFPVIIFTTEGVIQYINKSLGKILFLRKKKLLGSSIFDLIDLPTKSLFIKKIKTLLKNKTKVDFNSTLKKSNRKSKIFSLSITIYNKSTSQKNTLLIAILHEAQKSQASVPKITNKENEILSAIKNNEERLRLSLDAVNDAVWEWLPLKGVLYWSQGYLTMLGYGPAEIKPSVENWKMLLHPDDMVKAEELLLQCINNETDNFLLEARLQTKSKNWCWVSIRGKVISRNSKHEIIRMVGTHRDISEQKKTEENLISITQRLNDVIEFIPDPAFVIDQEKKVIFWNKAIETVTGIKKEEILGKGNFEYALPFFGERRPILIDLLDQPNETIERDYKYVKRIDEKIFAESFLPILYGGKGAHLWGVAAPLYDKDGNRFGSIEVLKDVNDLKRKEEALIASEQRINSIFRVAPIGIGVTSNRILMEVNDYICRMLGYSREELIGQSARILYPTQEEYEFVGREKYKQIEKFKTGTVETKWKCKDGRIFDVLLSSTPLNLQEISGGVTFTALDITQRKRAEENLKKSEERYALAQQAATIGSWEWNIISGEVIWSEMIEPMFGFNKGEFKGTYEAYLQCLHPEDREKFIRKINAALSQLEDYKNFEFRIVWPDGTIRWMISNGSVFNDEQGKPFRMIGIVQDITNRKKIEQEIIDSERKLSESLKVAKVGYWEYDVPSGYFTFNDQYYTLHNTTVEEVGGYKMTAKHFAENFVYPEDSPSVGKAIAKAIDTKDPNYQYQFEGRIITVDKKPVWIIIWFRIVKDENGNTIKLIGVNQDINDRKKAEIALQKSEERFRLLIQNSNDVFSIIDNKGIQKFVSPSIERITGFPYAKLVGKNITEIVHPDDLKNVIKLFTECLENPNKIFSMEFRHICKNGEYKFLESIGQNFLDDPLINGIVVNTRDISERKKAEEEILKRKEELERLEKIVVGRELKMIELKQKIANLEAKIKE